MGSIQRRLRAARDAALACVSAAQDLHTALVEIETVGEFRGLNSELCDGVACPTIAVFMQQLAEFSSAHAKARSALSDEIQEFILASSATEEAPRAGEIHAETWHKLLWECASSFFADLSAEINAYVLRDGSHSGLNSFANAAFGAIGGHHLEDDWALALESVQTGTSEVALDVVRSFRREVNALDAILNPPLNIEARIRREWAAADKKSHPADKKADTPRKKAIRVPRNPQVLKLIRSLNIWLPRGRKKIDIAREITDNDKKARNLLRQVLRYPELL